MKCETILNIDDNPVREQMLDHREKQENDQIESEFSVFLPSYRPADSLRQYAADVTASATYLA